MSRITAIAAGAIMLAWSADAPADFKSEYFDTLLKKDAERLENIDDVLFDEGSDWACRGAEYYEKTSSVLLDPGDERTRSCPESYTAYRDSAAPGRGLPYRRCHTGATRARGG
ncbi:MAG: hypothetical protein U5K38_15760 [Woeseiaceae bacterium]|nr:hypothetical protein [Woeseiaceae bacterium]